MNVKTDTIYAMVLSNGSVHAYSPLNPFDFSDDTADGRAGVTKDLADEKGITFMPLPNYELLEIWAHEDGTIDLVAKYTGEPCNAEGCTCEEQPYSIFPNGKTPEVASEKEILLYKMSLIMSGAVRIDPNNTVI